MRRSESSPAGSNTGVKRFLACAALLVATACSEPVDLKQAVEVTDISAGWYDVGVVNGQNKLVPSVTFRVRKKSEVDLSGVSLNLLFKRLGEDAAYDEVFLQRVTPNGEPITVRAETGYTADPPQSRADMLKHSAFRDVSIQIFAKQSSAQWIELGKVNVPRQVLTN
jgi:hypothetical protein